MEKEIKLSATIFYDGTVWHIKINDTTMRTRFRNKTAAKAHARFINDNADKIADAVSAELGG